LVVCGDEGEKTPVGCGDDFGDGGKKGSGGFRWAAEPGGTKRESGRLRKYFDEGWRVTERDGEGRRAIREEERGREKKLIKKV